MNPTRLFSIAAFALVAMFTLAGCDIETARTPSFEEDRYQSELAFEGQWSVKFNGIVNIEVDKEGTVNVYGFAQSNGGGGTSSPDIKISGPSKFAVHGCDRVTVVNGATVSAYSCSVVRARSGTTIDAYNCGMLEAYGAVKSVVPHGSTQFKKLPEPDSQLPVEKPASKPTPQAPPEGSPTTKQAQ